jgi:DNA polymerase III alpha subunit
MVHVNTGRTIDLTSQTSGDDPATRRLFRTGRTLGVFYTESPASRIVNEQSQAEDFEILVLNTSIIRPASNKWIKIYLDRHRNGADATPPHPSVVEALRRSYGIMVYQEDVVNVAHAFAGFSWADADGLRKALSKKRPEKLLAMYRTQFESAALALHRPMLAIDQLWEMILSFSGYSFCKGHSCSYIQVAQQSCYIRANYPAEFFAGVLANEGGFYRTFAYVAEAQREGLEVLAPDVNVSAWRWTGSGRTLRAGFQSIKGVTVAGVESLLAARATGPFLSLADVRARTTLRDDECRLLIKVGALDSVAGGKNRPQLLWLLDSTRPGRAEKTRLSLPPDVSRLPSLIDYATERKRRDTWELLGFCRDCHPMTLYRKELATFRITWQADLQSAVGRRVLMTGLYITGKPVSTVNHEPMQFATFDDGTGLVECVLFPETYRRYSHLLFDQGPFLFRGVVEESFGVRTITVSQIERLDRVLARRGQTPKPVPV